MITNDAMALLVKDRFLVSKVTTFDSVDNKIMLVKKIEKQRVMYQ
jgi:hypothetical protein